MKVPLRLLSLTALATVSLLTVDQLAAQTEAPVPGTTVPTGKKPSPLSSNDKQLVKKAAEAQLGLLHLGEIARSPSDPGSEATHKLGEKAVTYVNTSWGELGAVAGPRSAELPKTELSSSEKKEMAELKKNPAEKFDKAYLKALAKEVKKTAAVFGDGAKGASDADLRAYFAKWQPTVSTLNDQVAAAEAEESKKK